MIQLSDSFQLMERDLRSRCANHVPCPRETEILCKALESRKFAAGESHQKNFILEPIKISHE